MCKSPPPDEGKRNGEITDECSNNGVDSIVEVTDDEDAVASVMIASSSSPSQLSTPPQHDNTVDTSLMPRLRQRRRTKRDRQITWSTDECSASMVNNADDSVVLPITTTTAITTAITTAASTSSYKTIIKKKKKSRMTSKHADDTKSGGIDALLPTIACIIVLSVGIMARLGFRGRATVAGIDLGTTNSVICIQ
jgi:hypothetical protein